MKELFIVETGNKKVRTCSLVTLAVAVLFLLAFAGCAPAKQADVDKTHPWATVNLTIDKTSKYAPSFAIWVQDAATGDATTLYATAKAAQNKWQGTSARPGALPIWSAVSKDAPAETVDTYSSATPGGANAAITVQIPDKYKGKKITVFIEADVSYDYNSFYKEGLKSGDTGYNDVNGQPSILWKADLDTAASPEGKVTPTLAGHGDVLGTTADIDTDMTKITTAANILSNITIEYSMGK